MANESAVECPQCGHTNEPVEGSCAHCGINLEWALERGSQYWSEDAATRPPLILVSDDEPAFLMLYSKILESKGYRVARGPGAYITLDLAERLHPDLIITDLGKPGMSGIDMISRLKSDSDLRDIPVMVVSTHADKESVREATEAGAIRFLSKPFSPSDLTTTVASVLAGEPLPLALIQISWEARGEFFVPDRTHDEMCRSVDNRGFRACPVWHGHDPVYLAKMERPAVMVVAFHLPDQDGLDVLTRLRAEPDVGIIPVVMWFKEPDPELEQQAMQCGAQAVYTGPPDGDALAEVLRSVLKA